MEILKITVWILRAIQTLCAFVVIGLASYIRKWLSDNSWGLITSGAANYLIFVGGISIPIIIYLLVAPRFIKARYHNYVLVGIESVTALLWFSAFIAWIAYLNRHGGTKDCDKEYEICRDARAAVSFSGFEWALWMITSILSCVAVRKA